MRRGSAAPRRTVDAWAKGRVSPGLFVLDPRGSPPLGTGEEMLLSPLPETWQEWLGACFPSEFAGVEWCGHRSHRNKKKPESSGTQKPVFRDLYLSLEILSAFSDPSLLPDRRERGQIRGPREKPRFAWWQGPSWSLYYRLRPGFSWGRRGPLSLCI